MAERKSATRDASRQPVGQQARSAAALVDEQAPAAEVARLSDRTTRSGLARAPFPFEAEAPIDCNRWSPLLAADGSVSKRRWLSLSRPSGHRAGSPSGFPDGGVSTVISDSPTSYLCLRTGVCTNDDGAVESGVPVRQQATRQQLKATLLLPRIRSCRDDWSGSALDCSLPSTIGRSRSAAPRPRGPASAKKAAS